MKRINILYIGAIFLAGILYIMSLSMQSKSVFFYGFAENKQMEINHIEDVRVGKIHVTNGQAVKKGDLLLEVLNGNIPLKIEGLKLEKEAIDEDTDAKKANINTRISELRFNASSSIASLENKIVELEKKIELSKSLYDGLKSVKSEGADIQSEDMIKIENLRSNIANIKSKTNLEIENQKRLLAALNKPQQIKSSILDTELAHFEKKSEMQSIYAPSDGLIGTISCKEGENISGFSSLMNFYNHNPTQVKGYVHESMILEVEVGDKLEVASTLHPDINITGEVIGLGSRIVEIPERLRKIADFKTYGREVLIKIPSDNRFLQKEKVMLNISLEGGNNAFGNLFSSKDKKSSGSNNVIKE